MLCKLGPLRTIGLSILQGGVYDWAFGSVLLPDAGAFLEGFELGSEILYYRIPSSHQARIVIYVLHSDFGFIINRSVAFIGYLSFITKWMSFPGHA